MAIATTDELATYLGREPYTPDSTEEQRAQLLLDIASSLVEQAAGTPFEPRTDTIDLAGGWGPVLHLPGPPVTAVSAVSVNGLALVTGAWTATPRGIIRGSALDVDDCSPAQGAVEATITSWGGPSAAVRVTYTHGLDAPDWVKGIVLASAARALSITPGAASESFDVYSITYERDGGTVGLYAAEEKRLAGYRWW